MNNIGLAGTLAGVLALLGVVIQSFVNARGQDKTVKHEDDRLGHDELVAALAFQRDRIAALEQRAERAERGERECHLKNLNLERQLTSLLYEREMRKGGSSERSE